MNIIANANLEYKKHLNHVYQMNLQNLEMYKQRAQQREAVDERLQMQAFEPPMSEPVQRENQPNVRQQHYEEQQAPQNEIDIKIDNQSREHQQLEVSPIFVEPLAQRPNGNEKEESPSEIKESPDVHEDQSANEEEANQGRKKVQIVATSNVVDGEDDEEDEE